MYLRFLLVLAIAFGALSSDVLAGAFPGGPGNPSCPDIMQTGAAFKVAFLDGTEFTVFVEDDNTVIGRSDPHLEGDLVDVSGATICGAGAYPNMLLTVSDDNTCFRPADWNEANPTRREVHTEILAFELVGNGITIRAGQPYYNDVAGTALEHYFNYSTGEVASQYHGDPIDHSKDFDADSYFNVYCEVIIDLPGHKKKLFNKTPMLLRSVLTKFPPDFGLPTSTYIHDPTFGPVPLYDKKGRLCAYLLSAGHGSKLPDEHPVDITDAITIFCHVNFCVSAVSSGLDPLFTQVWPNDVFNDAFNPTQQVSIYRSSGAGNGPPDNSNGLAISGVNFAAGDAINSLSYGQDGTARPYLPENQCVLMPGALYFSVSRTSLGEHCSQVHLNATHANINLSEASADIYATRVGSFGHYRATGGTVPPSGENILVVDNASLGLSPTTANMNQDDISALELSNLEPFGMATSGIYCTLEGPSFTNAGAVIYVQDASFGSLDFASLTVFATPVQLGLQAGDVIDALAVSDVSPSKTCPPIANRSADVNLDQALFSLAPGSPSLTTGNISAADILFSDFDGSYSVFAGHSSLGLLASDDVDALDIKPIAPLFLTYATPPTVASVTIDLLQSNQPVTFAAYRIGGKYPFGFGLAPGSDALPAGFTLNSATGTIEGTPSTPLASPRTIVVRVTDSDSYTFDATIQLMIQALPSISYTSPSVILVNTWATISPVVSGGTPPYWFMLDLGSFPPFLDIDATTGVISGWAYTTGTFTSSIVMIDLNGLWATTDLTIHVISTASIVVDAGSGQGRADSGFIGTGERAPSMRIRGYPNPAQNDFTIEYRLLKQTHVELTLYDTRGRTLRTLVSKQQPPGAYTLQLKTEDIAAGVYYYRIKANGEILMNRLVIEN